MRELGHNMDLIKEFGADDVVLKQVLRQLIYFIVSISLNQLLGKCKDLCFGFIIVQYSILNWDKIFTKNSSVLDDNQ